MVKSKKSKKRKEVKFEFGENLTICWNVREYLITRREIGSENIRLRKISRKDFSQEKNPQRLYVRARKSKIKSELYSDIKINKKI